MTYRKIFTFNLLNKKKNLYVFYVFNLMSHEAYTYLNVKKERQIQNRRPKKQGHHRAGGKQGECGVPKGKRKELNQKRMVTYGLGKSIGMNIDN